jgi:NADH-quinone oxidoreductase subunit N
MTPTSIQAMLPVATWLAAALLCLLLEAAGTPVGARKRGARTHLPWVLALAGAVVVTATVLAWPSAVTPAMSASGLVFDRQGLLATALIAVLVVFAHLAAAPGLRAMDEDRGEMSAAYAVLGAALSLFAVAADLLALTAAVVLGACATSLLAAPDRDGPHGIEAATKAVIGAGVLLVLFSLAIVFTWAASGATGLAALGGALSTAPALAIFGAGLVLVALAILLGAVPLHQSAVDVAHGAAPAASSLLVGGALVAGGAATLRFADAVVSAGGSGQMATAWAVLSVLTLVGAPVAALDQSRVVRVVAYLTLLPCGVLLAAVAAAVAEPSAAVGAWRAGMAAVLTGGLGVTAALLGVAVPRLDPASTWEDWAGFGRRRPVLAALLVYALGALAGLPGTVGFGARLDVARAAFHAQLDVLGLVVIASAAVGASPIVRLALFFFAKEPPPRAERAPPPGGVLLVVAFALLVVAGAALAMRPGVVDALVAAARR